MNKPTLLSIPFGSAWRCAICGSPGSWYAYGSLIEFWNGDFYLDQTVGVLFEDNYTLDKAKSLLSLAEEKVEEKFRLESITD